MKSNVGRCEFSDAFRDMGRGDSFSYDGLNALYDYLEQLEEDTGEEIELDVIALDCKYSEYDSALEVAEEYGWEPDEDDDEDEREEAALRWLQDRTTVITFTGGVIVAGF